MGFTRRRKIMLICIAITGIILLAIGIALPFIIESLVKKEARNNAVMKTSNQNVWANFPGETQTVIKRNFYLYNFTNPDEVLFLNKTPELVEFGPYVYQESQNLEDLNYTQDGNIVKYNFWMFEQLLNEGRDVNEQIGVVNFGAVGVWNQLKSKSYTPDYNLLLQAFGQLITGLQTQIVENILCQALKQIFYSSKDETIQSFVNIGIPKVTASALWSDPFYGFNSTSTLTPWVRATRKGINSDSALLLQSYFRLSFDELYNIIEGNLKSSIDAVHQLANNNYCINVSAELCNGDYFAAVQWSTQNITMNPPGGINPQPSIANSNISAIGYPEISYFHKEVFLKTINSSEVYRNVAFDPMWAYNRLRVSKNPKTWLTDQDVFLHVGNLQILWTSGEQFDKSRNLSDLSVIMTRFKMDSLYQAHVLWSYLKYLLYDFAMNVQKGGNREYLGGGAFASQGIYNAFVAVKNQLLPNITGHLWMMNNKNRTCEEIMTSSMSNLSNSSLVSLCNNFLDINFINKVILVCDLDHSPVYDKFVSDYSLNHLQVLEICDPTLNNKSLLATIEKVQNTISKHYNCKGLNNRCSNEEVTVMQFANSTITENIFPELESIIPKQSNFFVGMPFEIKYFKKKYQSFLNQSDMDGISFDNALKLLTFDSLFSGILDSQAFVNFHSGNLSGINLIFPGFEGQENVLISFLKKMGIDWYLGGFSTTRAAKDFILGYDIPLLQTLAETDPAIGGNPSIQYFMGFSLNNSRNDSYKFPMAFYTGQDDYRKTREFQSVFGTNVIRNNVSQFDGNTTNWVLNNPWMNDIKLKGSDGFQNCPNLSEDQDVDIVITDFYRGAFIRRVSDGNTYSGLNTWRYQMPPEVMANKTNNPNNAVYYADKYNGLLNLTSVFQTPVFVSKRYFYGGDSVLFDSVKMYSTPNKSETNRIFQSSDDELIVDIEPYTGAMIYATEKLMFSLEFTNDSFFVSNNTIVIPMLYMNREGQFSDSAVPLIYLD